MSALSIRRSYLLAFLIVAFGLAASAAIIVVHAQTAPSEPSDEEVKASGITFPVPELGNCASKTACKSYCDESANLEACIKFAKSRGLMNKDEAERAEKFASKVQQGAGPGGCRTPRDCEAFCRDINNIETCVQFAEEQGFKGENVEQGKKVLAYVKAGGQMPGGCTSKESCEKYCGDFSHAEECFAFAQKAGIAQVPRDVPGRAEGRFEGGIPPGQFQKFIEAVKTGATPGGCKSKDECEAYCSGGSNFEECLAFGERVGFVDSEQAAKIRRAGGKGPGGCDSPRACETFCNNPANQEACFKFAEENGLLRKEDVTRAREGMIQLRAGLEQAPPEVAACVKSVLGEDLLRDIESGKRVPGPEVGDRLRRCFEKFSHRVESEGLFEDAPDEVKACLKEKLGAKLETTQRGGGMPTPEMADTFRVCFNQVRILRGEEFGPPRGEGEGEKGGFRGEGGAPRGFGDFLRGAPPQIASCLKEKLGAEYEQIAAGGAPSSDIKEKVRSCFESFRPETQEQKFSPDTQDRSVGDGPQRGPNQGAPFDRPQGGPFSPTQGGKDGSFQDDFRKEFGPPFRGGFEGSSGGAQAPPIPVPAFRSLNEFPPAILECVTSLVGGDAIEGVKRGERKLQDFGSQIRQCAEKIQGNQFNQQFNREQNQQINRQFQQFPAVTGTQEFRTQGEFRPGVPGNPPGQGFPGQQPPQGGQPPPQQPSGGTQPQQPPPPSGSQPPPPPPPSSFRGPRPQQPQTGSVFDVFGSLLRFGR